jgi:hypothetical protein
MQCRGCGGQNDNSATKCVYCDAALASEGLQPPAKANQLNPDEPMQPAMHTSVGQPSLPINPDYMNGLSPYYIEAFNQFNKKPNAGLQPKFNWGAFFFGGFWYLYKGLWVKGLLFIAIAFFSAGFLAIIPWIYGSVFGTYDYYLLKKDDKQLW